MPTMFIEPFDFRRIFIEFFIGDANLFALFFILIYSFLAAKWGFSNRIYFLFLIIGVIIFSAIVGVEIYIIAMLIFGGFLFKVIANWIV